MSLDIYLSIFSLQINAAITGLEDPSFYFPNFTASSFFPSLKLLLPIPLDDAKQLIFPRRYNEEDVRAYARTLHIVKDRITLHTHTCMVQIQTFVFRPLWATRFWCVLSVTLVDAGSIW